MVTKYKMSPYPVSKADQSISTHIYQAESYSVLKSSFDQNRATQKERVNLIRRTCKTYKQLINTKPFREAIGTYFVAPHYNWSYCKIGKMGSTLWSQFFYILQNNGSDLTNILNKSRFDTHTVMDKAIQHGVDNSGNWPSRMVVSARNPYTRLFSAYIDRMFIPSTTQSVRGDTKCKSEITFTEFLRYVIKNNKRGMHEYHWTPTSMWCKPCKVNPTFVIKVETLKNDFHYIVNQTDLEPYKMAVLSNVMNAQTVWNSLAVVNEVLDSVTRTNQYDALKCQTWEDITHRLWESFQIQGFISETAPFPRDLYKDVQAFENSSIFRGALVDARKRYPLSRAEMTSQRQRAMNRYYERVDPDVIEGIQEMYKVDFEMFGYSKRPPPW